MAIVSNYLMLLFFIYLLHLTTSIALQFASKIDTSEKDAQKIVVLIKSIII